MCPDHVLLLRGGPQPLLRFRAVFKDFCSLVLFTGCSRFWCYFHVVSESFGASTPCSGGGGAATLMRRLQALILGFFRFISSRNFARTQAARLAAATLVSLGGDGSGRVQDLRCLTPCLRGGHSCRGYGGCRGHC